jgi:hypothetical protein
MSTNSTQLGGIDKQQSTIRKHQQTPTSHNKEVSIGTNKAKQGHVDEHQQTIARRCQQAPTKQNEDVLMNINRPQQ